MMDITENIKSITVSSIMGSVNLAVKAIAKNVLFMIWKLDWKEIEHQLL